MRECLARGRVILGSHFRRELAAEDLDLVDAWQVLRSGNIYAEPEPDIKTGEWKYRVEGYEPGGKWLAIVFSFKSADVAFLITTFSLEAKRRKDEGHEKGRVQ
ncbi:MAG: DUF4258 domain-containing protein [Acidobacteriia bacterium]|nr:DUF4258 domain-containing protein [Terriglobia bacterium]